MPYCDQINLIQMVRSGNMNIWACSSVVERHTDNMEVDGSIPSTPTAYIHFPLTAICKIGVDGPSPHPCIGVGMKFHPRAHF